MIILALFTSQPPDRIPKTVSTVLEIHFPDTRSSDSGSLQTRSHSYSYAGEAGNSGAAVPKNINLLWEASVPNLHFSSLSEAQN